MPKIRFAYLHMVFLVALLISAVTAGSTAASPAAPDLRTLSSELTQLNGFYRVGTDGRTVVFDSARAKQSGFSPTAIKLAEETAAFTNDLVNAAINKAKTSGATIVGTINLEGVTVDINKYPTLVAYNSLLSQQSIAAGTLQVTSAQSVCGSKTTPVPNYAANWVKKSGYSSQYVAEQTLKSWGYYSAWWIPGGDWTRNQTYQESICKKNNYRDHSRGPWQEGTKWYFREQNYTGTVPGEPNPVMSSYPGNWPYLTWPDYVWWWHGKY